MKENKRKISSEVLPGIFLVVATLLALLIANTPLYDIYEKILYGYKLFGVLDVHGIINDFLMAFFFLVVGCEIKREFILGNLSNFKAALFPIVAAIGGMVMPALIYFLVNINSDFKVGTGIPISTDIAFAIGIYSILKSRMNEKLKIFLLTLAVVDDLMSIVVIGVFYSSHIRIGALIIAIAISVLLFFIDRFNKNNSLIPYMVLGLVLWAVVYYSGVHATISGVILAFSIPISENHKEKVDLNERIKEKLEPYVNYAILPLFAFSNTGIPLNIEFNLKVTYPLVIGIVAGLVIGKPLGIMLFSYIGEKIGILSRPKGVSWMDVLAVATLAGIGFTMAIFVAEIAFKQFDLELEMAKISILLAAIISIALSYSVTLTKKSHN